MTGAYWSSGAIFEKGSDQSNGKSSAVVNPKPTRDFLALNESEFCLGWMFVGNPKENQWPEGRRKELEDGIRLTWK